ncbi:MAG: hypothetical protein LN588_00015 [Rickettsia endosymbiont of Bryobia graminum]|nr:hypothetical protein [Rickettsia endosymbiont of Bryobia graminum]
MLTFKIFCFKVEIFISDNIICIPRSVGLIDSIMPLIVVVRHLSSLKMIILLVQYLPVNIPIVKAINNPKTNHQNIFFLKGIRGKTAEKMAKIAIKDGSLSNVK